MADGKTYHAIEDAVDPISIAVKDINHRRQVHHDCWDRVYAFSTISRLTMLIMTSCALNPDLWGWGSSKGYSARSAFGIWEWDVHCFWTGPSKIQVDECSALVATRVFAIFGLIFMAFGVLTSLPIMALHGEDEPALKRFIVVAVTCDAIAAVTSICTICCWHVVSTGSLITTTDTETIHNGINNSSSFQVQIAVVTLTSLHFLITLWTLLVTYPKC